MKHLLTVLVLTITACQANKSSFTQPKLPVSGLLCQVYDLPTHPSVLPNFDALVPIDSYVMDVVNFSTPSEILTGSSVSQVTWFGIECKGKFKVDAMNEYKFTLKSDDGSRLKIGSYELIDNDGHHSAVSKSKTVILSEGEYEVTLQYMQGVGLAVLQLNTNILLEVYH